MSTFQKAKSKWMLVSHTREPAIGRLLCIPFAGGGAAAYHPWVNGVLPGVELIRIRLPGRESRLREPLIDEFDAIIGLLVQELIPWLDLPFFLYGHSMGALLAFELARELRRTRGILPARLFVGGFRAPHLPPPDSPFSHLPTPAFLDRVLQYGGIPSLILNEPELMDIFVPILRADFRIIESYVYKEEPPLECPITAFGGMSDPKVTKDRIDAWRIQTAAGFDSHFFNGGHFFLQDSSAHVIERLNAHLAGSILSR